MTPTIVGTEPQQEMSIAELRAAYNGAKAAEVEPEIKPDSPEAEAENAETQKGESEPEPGAGEKEQEPELTYSRGTQKKIAQEAARIAAADLAIRKIMSERKAKEAELAKLTGESGAEPAKTTEPVKQSRPTRPVKPELSTFKGTLDELTAAEAKYEADLAKYETDLEAYFHAETEKTFEQRYAVKQAESAKRSWMEESAKTHGADFPEVVARLESELPEPLQVGISALGKDAAAMVVHLGKNPDALKILQDTFKANPYAAIAELGKLQLKLAPEPKQDAPKKAPPKALEPVGGGASAGHTGIDLTKPDEVNKASDGALMKEIRGMAKAAKR